MLLMSLRGRLGTTKLYTGELVMVGSVEVECNKVTIVVAVLLYHAR